MIKIRLFHLALMLFFSLNVDGQYSDSEFKKVYNLIHQRDFFKARDLYSQNKDKLSLLDQSIVEVFLDNAFNQLQKSNQKISYIISSKNVLPDSLWVEIYKVKEGNSVKLFDYKEAKNSLETILTDYKNVLSKDERKDLKNNLKIWRALEDESAQMVNNHRSDTLKMIRDKAGLNNLVIITTENDTIPFVFDTGANLSTVSESIAKKMHMKSIPVDIEIATMTGENVVAQLGGVRLLNWEIWRSRMLFSLF